MTKIRPGTVSINGDHLRIAGKRPDPRDSDISRLIDHPVQQTKRGLKRLGDGLRPLRHARNWNPTNVEGSLHRAIARTGEFITEDVSSGLMSGLRWTKRKATEAYARPMETVTREIEAETAESGGLAPTRAMAKHRFLKHEIKSASVVGPAELAKGVAFTVDAATAGHFTGGHGLLHLLEMANSYENAAGGPMLILAGLAHMGHLPQDAVNFHRNKKQILRMVAEGQIDVGHLKQQDALGRSLTGHGTLDLLAHARLLRQQGYDTTEIDKRNETYLDGLIGQDMAKLEKQRSRIGDNKLLPRLLDRALREAPSLELDTGSSMGQAKLARLADHPRFEAFLYTMLQDLPEGERSAVRERVKSYSEKARTEIDQKTDLRIAEALRAAHGISNADRRMGQVGGNIARALRGAPNMAVSLAKPIVKAPVELVATLVTMPAHLAPATKERRDRRAAGCVGTPTAVDAALKEAGRAKKLDAKMAARMDATIAKKDRIDRELAQAMEIVKEKEFPSPLPAGYQLPSVREPDHPPTTREPARKIRFDKLQKPRPGKHYNDDKTRLDAKPMARRIIENLKKDRKMTERIKRRIFGDH